MLNLDLIQAKKMEIMQKLNTAIKEGNEEGFNQALTELTDTIQQAVVLEAKGMLQTADNNILVGRGVRQLTTQENQFYQSVIEAMKTSNPKQALSDLENVMPKTIIDAVFEDLVSEHPLLDAINFTNTSGLVEYLVNTDSTQLATWSPLTSEIVKELTSGFKKINLSLYKLSAFLPVAKAMLDLGPEWLDRYVRAVLGEAIAFGLEEGIVNGTGKNMPIGMNRQVGEGVVVTDGVYPLKDTVAVTSLDPVTYGSLISGMAVGPNGKSRIVRSVIMLVNPVDYLQKVMPATTIRSADGTYVNNILPYPTTIIPSVQVPQGKAIFGLASRYFMGVGTAKSGKIEYSDEYKFLEDERVYLIKLYGHGEPLDNAAFVYADISGLKPAVNKVFVTNTESDPIASFVTNSESDPIASFSIDDARLASLSIGALDLVPTFNKSTFSYTVETANATNTINAIAMDGEATIEILVNDVAHTNGTAATWADGENTVSITVTIGTETETYDVVVTKPAA